MQCKGQKFSCRDLSNCLELPEQINGMSLELFTMFIFPGWSAYLSLLGG